MAYFMPLAALWPRPNDVSVYPVEAGAFITSSEWLLFLFVFFAIFSVFISKFVYNNQSCTAVREHARDESL